MPFRPRRSPRMSLRSSMAQRAGRSSMGTKMTCAHCRTPLQKGQTAYQRKGLPQLFCSSSCLTTFSKKPLGKKTCTFCKKYVRVLGCGAGQGLGWELWVRQIVLAKIKQNESGRVRETQSIWLCGHQSDEGWKAAEKKVVLNEYSNLFFPLGRSGTPRTRLWRKLVQEAPFMSSARLSVCLCTKPSSSAQSPSLGILLMPLAAAYARRLER